MRRSWSLALVSLAFLASGHWAAYVLAIPSASLRSEILEHTGHTWYSSALPLAVAALLIGLVASYTSGSKKRLSVKHHMILQLAAYFSVEIQERALSGHTLSDAVSEVFSPSRILLLGLLFQILAVYLARRLTKAISDLYERHHAREFQRAASLRQLTTRRVSSLLINTSLQPRAPPGTKLHVF